MTLKISKRYIIFAAIVIALALHLADKKTDPTHSYLPRIPAIDTALINRIVITKSDESITLIRDMKDWKIEGYDGYADGEKVSNMIMTVGSLKVIMMISQLEDYIVFGLDRRNKINVSVYNNDTELYEFEVGNVGPSREHTFVRLKGDERVFYVEGSIRDIFNVSKRNLKAAK